MKVHEGELTDVTRYLESRKSETLEGLQPEYQAYMKLIRKFADVTPQTRILEIGTGTGWFPLLCKMDGIFCKGLEISPQLVEHAKELGRRYGVEPDIELGNVEESDVGADCYDVIVANSVFEHIEHWRIALDRVYKALRPGGVFFFASTNKFRFVSSEYDFPLYDWLPNRLRFRLRVARQGPDIMKLGIDFNQFTYPLLRKAFRQAGFRRVYDRMELADPANGSGMKAKLIRLGRRNKVLKNVALTFCDATTFVCVK